MLGLTQLHSFYFYLTAIPACLNSGIIIYILVFLPKGKTTDLFTLVVTGLLLCQIEAIIIHLSPSSAQVLFWDKILCLGWISLAPVLFHFACRFTRLNVFSSRTKSLCVYLPFLVLYLLHISRPDPLFRFREGWGWVQVTDGNSPEAILGYFIAAFAVGSVVILFHHAYKKRNDRQERMQAWLIAIGLSIPAIHGIVTQVIFQFLLSRYSVNVTPAFFTFFSIGTLIALSRYQLFNISESVKVETVLANLKNIVMIISPDEKILYMNPYARNLFFGLTDWKHIPPRIKSIFYSDELYNDFIRDAFESGKRGIQVQKHHSSFAVHRSGKIDVILSVDPITSYRNGHGMLVVANDITEQVKTIETLRHTNERFNIVCRATNDMVWDWNLETGEVYRNKEGWKKIFNSVPDGEIGTEKSWEEMVHPDDRNKMQLMKKEILKLSDNQFFEIEARIIKADGSIAYIHDRGFVIRDKDGKPLRLVGAAQDISRRKIAEKKLLEEQQRKQDEITEAVISAQENERQKIGGELHDNVNQILASSILYLNLSIKEEEKRSEYFAMAKSMITEAIAEIRKLSHSMIPPSLNAHSLTYALQNLLDRIQHSGMFEINTDFTGLDEDLIPDKVKLTFYRIVQEQLNNIIKYAEATKVELKLNGEKGKIILSISDNGKGFDPSCKSDGVGLMNIRSRASLHGGEMTILSAPGQGCQLVVTFPETWPVETISMNANKRQAI